MADELLRGYISLVDDNLTEDDLDSLTRRLAEIYQMEVYELALYTLGSDYPKLVWQVTPGEDGQREDFELVLKDCLADLLKSKVNNE